MVRDARALPDGAVIESDVCVVGAGPAGIALALAFAGSSVRVLLIESGALGRNSSYQRLNDGIVIGDAYAPLKETRHRRAGGTAHLWNTPVGRGMGAKYLPLDATDFEPIGEPPLDGWPFGYGELVPFYLRAQEVCGLGRFEYDGAAWAAARRPFSLAEPLSTKIYQFGPGRIFTETHLEGLRRTTNVTLLHDATACALEAAAGGGRVTAASVATFSRARISVRADVFVLAAGALENARLLLASSHGSAALGNASDWVGRCLMEHPRDGALMLLPRSKRFAQEAAFYDGHAAPDGTVVCGRIALDATARRTARLPNASITLVPEAAGRWGPARYAGWVADRLRAAAGVPPAPRGYGWSHPPRSAHPPARFRLLLNVEQRPSPDNRIVLARATDRVGLRRLEVHWRFGREERLALARLRAAVASALEASGLGTVVEDTRAVPDPNAHHHAGTTRMHPDARQGVVDAYQRVHGTDNLYVAGASVFPTSGFANPTLTIVALSLRLGDRLRQVLQAD